MSTSSQNQISKDGKCVLFVAGDNLNVRTNQGLKIAQIHALEQRLPLAVIYRFDKPPSKNKDLLDNLREQERILEHLGIPLMLLIGDPDETLKAVTSHTMPEHVYFDEDHNETQIKLAVHPYKWPGVVIPIDSLGVE